MVLLSEIIGPLKDDTPFALLIAGILLYSCYRFWKHYWYD